MGLGIVQEGGSYVALWAVLPHTVGKRSKRTIIS